MSFSNYSEDIKNEFIWDSIENLETCSNEIRQLAEQYGCNKEELDKMFNVLNKIKRHVRPEFYM